MEAIKNKDRVVVYMNFKIGDTVIQKGTVGTCRIINDSISVVQVASDNADGFLMLNIPDSILSKAEAADLERANPSAITPKMFHPGNVWTIPTGYDNGQMNYVGGEIIGVRLALNENYDKLMFKLEDGEEAEYERRFIENQASYFPINFPEYVPEYVQDKQEEKDNDRN